MERPRHVVFVCVGAVVALAGASPGALGATPLVSVDKPARGALFACNAASPLPGAAGTLAAKRPSGGVTLRRVGRSIEFVTPRLEGRFTARPPVRRTARCVALGTPVGVARDGTPIFAPVAPAGVSELDECGGVTVASAGYQYRGALRCLRPPAGRSVGYARDGFPITGPDRSRKRLDACHGHTHTIQLRGKRVRIYHYHATNRFPFTVGCFRGRPEQGWRTPAPANPLPSTGSPAAASTPTPADEEPVTALEIATDPPLLREFSRGTPDYVLRCSDAATTTVTVAAPSGTSVSVDGTPGTGRFTRAVALRPGQALKISVTDGSATTEHSARCLPADFPTFTATRTAPGEAGWFLTTPATFIGTLSYAAVFDASGTPVWWMKPPDGAINMSLLANGNFAWADWRGAVFGVSAADNFEERALDGSVARTWQTTPAPPDFHDFQILANGNALMLTYVPRDHVDLTPIGGPADATVLDAEVQEVSPEGIVVWSWNSASEVAMDEIAPKASGILAAPPKLPDGRTAYDIVHANSLSTTSDGVLLNLLMPDATYHIDRATGQVDWKFGGTMRSDSLTIVDDPLGRPVAQHDVRELPDGTLSMIDVRRQTGQSPRAARYALDVSAGTATLVETVAPPRALNAPCCGSARRMPAGGWTVSWGGTPVISEHAAGGTAVLTLEFAAGMISYRAIPVSPDGLDRATLRAAMDAQAESS